MWRLSLSAAATRNDAITATLSTAVAFFAYAINCSVSARASR
jgi:hypothetical protein